MEDYSIFEKSYGKRYRVVFYTEDLIGSIQVFYGIFINYTGRYLFFEMENGAINIIEETALHHMICKEPKE